MYRLSLLPVSLVALLLCSSGLAAEPTTPVDPFYHISKFVQRPPEPPVCCLKPLQSDELPVEEILSFEEWKVKQEQALLRKQQEQADGSKSRGSATKTNPQSTSSGTQRDAQDEADGPPPLEPPTPPPHFRVPLTDRFNYASLDCSARVHYAHRSARQASSLLSSKKDKYMLSPCNTPGEDKFVVVELCEDIRIDTVQLANFEFFSGVFKDFSVSVARTYTTDPDGWTPAGTYRAKNIRGIQSFHPPTSLRDFYRFIRIDFHSHYGNEYYCPISLLRVYGLTHLEQWKWEVWEAEYKAKNEAQAAMRSIASAPAIVAKENVQVVKETTDKEVPASAEETRSPFNELPSDTTDADSPPTETSDSILTDETISSAPSEASSTLNEVSKPTNEQGRTSSSDNSHSQNTAISSADRNGPTLSHSLPSSSSSLSIHFHSSSEVPFSDSVVRNASSTVPQSPDPSPSQSSQKLNSSDASVISSTQMPTIVAHESRAVPAVTATGESIYRTIMTRLSILEANSSLYLRYVEEQTRSLRDALTRLEEDVGRLEGLSKATTQSFQKIINEMDRQRRRLEREHGELQTRVDYLTDEVILEKRLGIAQLCLLLVVLVFMVLTRGSRGEPFIPHVSSGRRDALREWGRRHFSNFGSGEWSSKARTGSPTRIAEDFVKSPVPLKKIEKINFPDPRDREGRDSTPRTSTANLPATLPAKGRTPAEIRAPHPRHFVSHRPRTPTSSTFAIYGQATRSAGLIGSSGSNLGAVRPRPRRASSHSTPVPVANSQSMREGNANAPISVKKWAKSAHLHEIRKKNPRRAAETLKETGSTPVKDVSTEQEFDQENLELDSAEKADDDSKEALPADPRNSADDARDSEPRNPFSISPIQNRSRREDRVNLDRLRLEQPCPPTGGPNIIDLETESENWEDTDSVANSEVDEQFT